MDSTAILPYTAPVSQLAGVGKGWFSREAMQRLLSLCYQSFERKEAVSLLIKSDHHEYNRTIKETDS
ncbi:hypothetical protein GCM10008085_27160 [Winogradskyella epiphytica]|nr:hypothetical protein GCM10008085_27160 [Winogradskyella epiphytica]